MTSESKHVFRKLFAVALLMFGMTILALDVHTSFRQQGPLHYLNIAVAVGLGFVGGWLLNRLEAESIVDAILKRLPLPWPGGMRRSDPPPDPRVPLPPSVTESTGIIYGSANRPAPPPPKDCP